MSISSNSFATFSGGGWNSHTVSSAMVGGAIEAAKQISHNTTDLGMPTLFGNLAGLAGNSGGSWFVSMLTYSEDFARDLANSPQDWFSTGYMGQQKELIGIPSKQAAAEALNGVMESIVASNVRSLPLYDEIKSKVLGNADVADFLAKTIFGTISKGVIDSVLALTPSSSDSQVENVAGLVSLFYHERNDDNAPSWINVVKDLAFGSYEMTQKLSKPLTMDRVDWAADKSIIFGAAKPNSATISYFDRTTGDSFIQQSTPVDNPVDTTDYYTPITMAIQPQSAQTGRNEMTFTAGALDLAYEKQTLLGNSEAQASATLSNLKIDDLSIIDMATISGSFAGGLSVLQVYPHLVESGATDLKSKINNAIESDGVYQALPDLLKKAVVKATDSVIDGLAGAVEDFATFLSGPLASFLADMAVPVNTSGGKAVVAEPERNGDIETIASAGNVRLLDGGYTDNTAVANILSQLQSSADSFEITTFINNTDTGEIPAAWTGHEALTVGSDVPKLFGTEGDDLIRPFTPFPGAPLAAYPIIFKQSAWQSEKPVWSYVDETNGTVIGYYQLDVETIDNPLFNVEAGRKGTLNVFSTVNTASGAGPYFPNAFDIYEGVYDATRNGIIANGGYIHVLESLGSMRLDWTRPDGGSVLRMTGSDGLSSKMAISVEDVSSAKDIFIDIYRTDATDAMSFVGTIGGAAQEQGMGHQGMYDLFRLGVGEALEFKVHGTSTNGKANDYVFDYQRSDSSYDIRVLDPESQAAVMSLELGYVPLGANLDGVIADQTERDDASDAFIYLSEDMVVDFSLQSPAAMKNTFSMIQVDVDQQTGAVTFNGYAEDTLDFDRAVRAAVEANEFFDKIAVDPYSESNLATQAWQAAEDGYYAPVLLTEDDKVYVAGHDLIAGSSQASVVGHAAFAFEDMPLSGGSDHDFNDLIVQMSIYSYA